MIIPSSVQIAYAFCIMVSGWITSLGTRAAQVKLLHPLYNAALGRLDGPLTFAVHPPMIFPGDAGNGQWIINGKINHHGKRLYLDDADWFLGRAEQDSPFFKTLHQFDFLRDLQALGGLQSLRKARDITGQWLKHFAKYNAIVWSPEITAKRLVNWLIAYPFAYQTADEDFLKLFHIAFFRQYFHLKYGLHHRHTMTAEEQFYHLWALLIVEFCCPDLWDDIDVNSHLLLLKGVLNDLILPDGCPVNRNLSYAVDLAKMLMQLHKTIPMKESSRTGFIKQQADKIITLVNNMTHGDKDLPQFQGAILPCKAAIDSLTRLSGLRLRRGTVHMPGGGYTAMRKGKTCIMIDHGAAAAHCSPLAFEMSSGMQRVITSCGAYAGADQGWRESLSGFPAHTVLEVHQDSPNPDTLKIKSSLETVNRASLFVGSHEGYHAHDGVIHTRRIYMDQTGKDIRGEDLLVRNMAIKPLPVTLRFHLHPLVKASQTQDHRKILLRLPNGTGWMVAVQTGTVSLEDSIYCESGLTIRKTRQIVIQTDLSGLSTTIKWTMRQ